MKHTIEKASFLTLTPLRIVLLYAVVGVFWILFSDYLLKVFIHDPASMANIAMIKGSAYVAATAVLLYFLIRRFERAYLASEQQYRSLMEQASDSIAIFNLTGDFLAMNTSACENLGYTEAEMLRLNVKDIFLPEDLAAQPIRFAELKAGRTILSERKLRRKDGTIFPAEISGKMLKDGRFLAIVRDISEHQRKDAMLAWRSRQLELLSNSNRQINTVLEIPVVMRTLVQTALAVTDAASGAAGILEDDKMVFREYNKQGELIPIDYAFPPGYGVPGWVLEHKKPYLSNDAANDAQVIPEIREKLGFYNLIDVPIFDRAGRLLGCFELHNAADHRPFNEQDREILEGLAAGAAVAMENALLLAEHKRAEASLREGEKKFRILAETTAAAIFIYQGASFRYMNSTAERMTGYTRRELMSMNFQDLAHPDYRMLVRKRELARQRGEEVPDAYEFKLIMKSGEERWVDFRSAVIEFDGKPAALGTVYDVTERKKLEEQFRQAHKMEAVGLLAGGIAHDFNNILTAIIGYGNLVKMKLAADNPVAAHVDQILASADRAANLTHSLLAFSRKQIINPKPVKINEIIIGVGKLLTRLIGEDIELTMELDGRAMTIFADPSQIEQVLMNLATNARDAMPDGGLLTIKTEHFEVKQDFITTHGYGSEGLFALLSVTDTGTGMDRVTQERIYEPFFTTKGLGKGTGLGLSMVYGIVKQHDGYITVASEPDAGSTFKIYFPLVPEADENRIAASPLRTRGGTETVLVAEDDEAVRNLTRTLLSGAGYTVIDAVDGEQAVAKFAENKDRITLLILDVIMPKKNGKEALEEIRRMRPDIKALFMSGYAADIFEKKNIPEEGRNLISKPILPAEFLRRVREKLDA